MRGALEKRLLDLQQARFHIERPMDYQAWRRLKFHQHPCEPGFSASNGPSDIVLHLPVLEWYASLCGHVTEFGTRGGDSTVALCSAPEVHSYDIEETFFVRNFRDAPKKCRWVFHRASTVDPAVEIEPTDFLLFDTLHHYSHLRQELVLHGHKVRRFLAFHDTHTCGEYDRSGPDPSARGILPAIAEYISDELSHGRRLTAVYRTDANNGLLVLERAQPG